MRASLAYLRANEAGKSGGGSSSSRADGSTKKSNSRKARAHARVKISHAMLAVAEAGHAIFDTELAHEVTRVCCDDLEATRDHYQVERELVAAKILVALSSSHMPTIVDEILSRTKAGATPNASLMFALEMLATGMPNDFVPCLSRILSRLIPMLGSVSTAWKLQVQITSVFTAFCEALDQSDNVASGADSLPGDVRASFLSAFDIFQSSELWLDSPKAAVRGGTARALGAMAGYVPQERICATSGVPTISTDPFASFRVSPDDTSRKFSTWSSQSASPRGLKLVAPRSFTNPHAPPASRIGSCRLR